jgi:hypothetical protein
MSSQSYLETSVEEILYQFRPLDAYSSLSGLDALPIFASQSIYKAASILAHDLRDTTRLDVS